jgi:hypothetical protein
MFYAALDVSLHSVAICIIDQDGMVRLERSVPSDVPDVVRCLRAFGEPVHRRPQHELTKALAPILAGSSHADDGMDEAANDCCASSALKSKALQTLIQRMRAAAPNEKEPTDCEEKRDPRERWPPKLTNELDPNARLEKRS